MPSRLLAHLRYQFYRHGWPALVGLLLIAGAAVLQMLGTDSMRKRADALDNARAAQRPRGVPAPDQAETQRRRLSAFYAALPGAAGALETVTTIHRAAQAHGVVLATGEYRLSRDGAAPLLRYQITLPVRATYPRLRAWVGDVMNAVPSASLDDISLRRDDAASETMEARVRFTLYLKAD